MRRGEKIPSIFRPHPLSPSDKDSGHTIYAIFIKSSFPAAIHLVTASESISRIDKLISSPVNLGFFHQFPAIHHPQAFFTESDKMIK